MSHDKNAYGSRKKPFSETINTIKSWYRKTRYLITDVPSFCKDLFSLKCNQITLRDCGIKNFAIQYIDINSRNAEKIYLEAKAKGDQETAEEYWYIHHVMKMYVDDLESRKQFFVTKEMMSDEEVAEAAARHPSLFRNQSSKYGVEIKKEEKLND